MQRLWVLDDPAVRAMLEGEVFDKHDSPVTVTSLTAPNPLLRPGQCPVPGALGEPLRHLGTGRMLVYSTVIDVPGYQWPTTVAAAFFEHPPYDTYGLPAIDYPRVWADLGAPSKHRMGDDALCLWNPFSTADRCWNHALGLLELFEVVRRHVFKERHWRTGDADAWAGREAPHGVPEWYQRPA